MKTNTLRGTYIGQFDASIRERMSDNQDDDPVIASAIKQLTQSAEISQGQYKTQIRMNIRDGLLCRGRKIVVPKISIPSTSTGFTPYRVMYGVDPRQLSVAALDADSHGHYYSVLDWV